MRLVDPPQTVLVQRDEQWCDGELRAWRRDLYGWPGFAYPSRATTAGLAAALRVILGRLVL
jgi:hypothetical protein